MRKILISTTFLVPLLFSYLQSFCWGFYAHQKINYYACFLLPPEMMVLYKPNIAFFYLNMRLTLINAATL